MTCSQPSSGEYVTAVCSGIRDTVKLPCSVVIDGYRIVSPCNQGSSTGVGSDVVQSPCDAGSYCVAGVSTKCPGGSYSSTSGSLSCTPILDCSITLGYIGVNGQCTCDVGYMGTVEAGATTTAMTGCIQICEFECVSLVLYLQRRDSPHSHIIHLCIFSKATTTTTASISTTSSATSNEDEASAAALFSISGIDQEMHIIYICYLYHMINDVCPTELMNDAISNDVPAPLSCTLLGDGGLIGDRKLLNDILISVASPSRIASKSTSLHFMTTSLLLIYVILM